MKRKVLVGILVGAILGIAEVSSLIFIKQQADKQQATKVVTFPDKGLEKTVRHEIGKPEGPIYAADLKKITELRVWWGGYY
jgi:hypothetical protein